VTTTVLELAGGLAARHETEECIPATCRIGLLGLGNIGSAFARLARDTTSHLAARGVAPIISTALVRSASTIRPAAPFVASVTDDAEAFFSEPVDLVVEALGGVQPAYTFVRRALDRGIPVVTANKSLIAAHGDELSTLAHRRRTALRFEASCIAGVPFLGAFERRPLASRASGITAILNGTSNSILTAMTRGGSFDAALTDAQRRGLAEPDPSMDVNGADAAEKLAILVRVFGRLIVAPDAMAVEGIDRVDADDIAAAIAFEGAIRPVARASWNGAAVRAHVGPTFLAGTHPLARVGGVTNGVVIYPERCGQGAQSFIGPGAGPDVTAATLLDDVIEVVTERRVHLAAPEPARHAVSIARPESGWFLRLTADAPVSDVADLLGSYGIWCTRIAARVDRTYVLTCAASAARTHSALAAVEAAMRGVAVAFPALAEEASC
jgi:homoserine dehydrogenase